MPVRLKAGTGAGTYKAHSTFNLAYELWNGVDDTRRRAVVSLSPALHRAAY